MRIMPMVLRAISGVRTLSISKPRVVMISRPQLALPTPAIEGVEFHVVMSTRIGVRGGHRHGAAAADAAFGVEADESLFHAFRQCFPMLEDLVETGKPAGAAFPDLREEPLEAIHPVTQKQVAFADVVLHAHV